MALESKRFPPWLTWLLKRLGSGPFLGKGLFFFRLCLTQLGLVIMAAPSLIAVLTTMPLAPLFLCLSLFSSALLAALSKAEAAEPAPLSPFVTSQAAPSWLHEWLAPLSQQPLPAFTLSLQGEGQELVRIPLALWRPGSFKQVTLADLNSAESLAIPMQEEIFGALARQALAQYQLWPWPNELITLRDSQRIFALLQQGQVAQGLVPLPLLVAHHIPRNQWAPLPPRLGSVALQLPDNQPASQQTVELIDILLEQGLLPPQAPGQP